MHNLPCSDRPALRAAANIAASLGVLFLLAGCQARVASYDKVDVCSVVKPIVAQEVGEVDSAIAKNFEPGAGACDVSVATTKGRTTISFALYTDASMAPTSQSFERILRLTVAEASLSYGAPPSNELADIAKNSATFWNGDGLGQIVLNDKGALLEISGGGGGISHAQGVSIARAAWKALLDYRPEKKS
jgi:hypothetical protein